uniref:WG repeat-containing protein n=1 Tax=Rhabditophanes sp. KR3021 TaxID=114890 RepID=A0AC35UHY9_9BILA
MLIGFGVLLSRNDVYHPIYVEKESQKVCAFDKTGVIYDVYFDGQGAPIIMSDGPLVGFVMKNNAPVYAANGGTFQKFKLDVEIIIKYINKLEEHPAYFTVNKFKKIDSFIYDIFETIDLKGALVNINKNIGVTVLKDYFVVPAISVTQSEDELNYPVYANKMGNLVTFDPEGNILKVHQDLRGIPCIVKDSVIYKGAIWHDGQIKYSLNLGRTFEIQLNVTKIRNTIFKLGANYPFYSVVYKPISIDSLMERMLANIGAKDITEAVGLVNIFPKNVASNFYTVPYFGIRLNNNDSFYPLYVNNKNMELFSFDESLKMYRVLFSEDLYPLVITESGVVYSGYIYTDGGPKYGTNFEKYNPARINVDLVISAVEKLSYSYFGYTTVHAPIEISYILTSLFSSMTVECAYGLISKNTTFKIVKENYVAVVGLSVPINDVWSPIYANKEGLLYAFNSDGTEIEVFIDIFGVPVIVIKDVRYAGYIMLNGSPKYAITEGILRPASIDVSVLVTTINRIGPSAPLFYCTCNSVDMNVILPEILNSIDHLLAHGPINAGLLEKVPLNYYAVPSVGIRIVTNGIIKYYPCYCHEGKLVFIDDTSKVYECMQDIQGAPIVNIDGPQYFGFLTLDLNRPLDLVADLEKIMGGLTLENSNNNIQYNDRPSVQDYIMVPGFGVQIVSNEKFVPVYCDRRFGNLKAFTEEGEVVRVVVDVQNIVVTISDSNIITQGFIVVDGKPRFSVTQGTTRQIVVDVNTIISTIERLGPDHPSYLTLHPPIDFKDLEKNFLNTITLENSIGLINSGLDISIPIGHAMVPGMGVALDNSKNYYPVFINTARKCVVYSNEGIMYNVLFGNGVPVCRSNEDPEVFYPGFIVYKNETRHSPSKSTYKEIQLDYNIIFNKVEQLSYEFVGYKFQHPKIEIDNLGKILEALNLRSARGLVNTEYTNVGLEYLLVPGMAVQYKTNWHALYVNKNGEVFTFIDDKPIDVVFDLQNLPRIEMDGSIYTGYVEYFNEIRHSVSVGSSVKLTFNITIIQNTLQRLGPEFENGFLSLPAHRPIDIQTDIGEILDSLDISNAIGLITAGLNFEVPEDFLMIPGMGTKVNLNSEYFPIYINSKSFDIVAFDRDGTVLKVKWDIQNAPCIVLNEGLIIPGYIYIKGQIRHSVIRGKVKAMTLDIEVIKRTIIRLGVNYSAGYKTLFRPPNINMILAKVYSSLTIDIALGALNSLTGIQVPKKYVPLAAFGVMIQNLTKTPRYVPVYVDIDGGNLLTFDE